jgi:hypothetical protein
MRLDAAQGPGNGNRACSQKREPHTSVFSTEPKVTNDQSEQTSIDTFVQLASVHISGLIVVVRLREANPAAENLMDIAERELGAFMRAVTQLFGPEQAVLAAEDWVDELESMDALPGPATRDWGSVTVAASARLARRLSAAID